MKKPLLLLTVLLLLAGLTSSIMYDNPTGISGTVLDDEGSPVILGYVTLYQNNQIIKGGETDFDGNYYISNINPGIYNVQFSYVGFPTIEVASVEIKLNEITTLDAQLNKGVDLCEIVVVGYKKPLIEVDNACSGSTVTADEINNLPVKDLGAIATSTAGVATSNDSPNAPNARGNRSGNTSYILDGIRVSGNSIPQSEIDELQKTIVGKKVQYGNVTGGIISIQETKDIKFKATHQEAEPAIEAGNYTDIIENNFFTPQEQALSTFSIDVDRASYANVRRMINAGQVPHPNAVRIEEMINYFEYDYPQPKGKNPFSINTQLGECPWNKDHQLLHIGLQGKTISNDDLPPSNLVFLIDVSGSMNSQNKLPLLKSAFKMLVKNLRDEDKVSIVVYAGAAGLVLEPTSGKDKNKILDALDKLKSGGSTAGGAGIELAYKTAREHFLKKGNNRVILATDGDFNVGTTGDQSLVELIEKQREDDIFLSILGFGTGNYMDGKMQQIADAGNGNHSYIDNLKEAQKILVREMNATLHTIAKDVKIQIEFNPANVESYRLIGYENRILAKEDFNDDTKDAGEIGSGHTVTAIYEIIPAGTNSSFSRKVDDLKFQSNPDSKMASSHDLAWVKFRYKTPTGTKSTKIEQGISTKVMSMNKLNDNFKWSASVAQFGMLLRKSKYNQNSSFENVLNLATKAKGKDNEGNRAEFIQIVKAYQSFEDTAQR